MTNKEYKAKYRIEHPDKVAVIERRYRLRNIEKIRTKNSIWRKNNSQKTKLYFHQWYSKKKSNGGTHSSLDWSVLKDRFNHCCAVCGMQEPFTDLYYPLLTEDHIIPVSLGGSNDIKNIQPLCFSCNCKKYNKIVSPKEGL